MITMSRASHRIVVTGVSSFIGAHLARALSACGNHVVGTVTRPTTDYSQAQGERLRFAVDGGAELRRLDLTDEAELRTFVRELHPDIWFHHAGFATNYGSPDFDFERAQSVNVRPLALLYPLLAEAGCRGVIMTGSASEYGEQAGVLSEDTVCLPSTPYGLSKLTETLRACQLAEQHGLKTRVARVFLPFGPLDSPNKLIPAALAALQQGTPMDMTSCEQRRDLLYIDDLISGFHALAEDLNRDAVFDIFNLAQGEPVELKAFLLGLADKLGADPAIFNFGARPRRAGEPNEQYGDSSKAAALLGWQARPWREGLADYVAEMTVTVGSLA